MAGTWSIVLDRLVVHDADEDDFFSDGDEPYLVTIGIRSRLGVPGTTQVFWSGILDDDWADGIDDGGVAGIPSSMGRLDFPGVEQPGVAELLAGARPEVIGAVVVAIESDATPFDAIRSKFEDIRVQLQQRLDQVIGGTPVNLADPAGTVKALTDGLKGVRQGIGEFSVGEKILLFLQSFGDPDDLIEVETIVRLAIDPAILGLVDPSALPPGVTQADLNELVLQGRDLNLRFGTDGIDYEVQGRVVAPPPPGDWSGVNDTWRSLGGFFPQHAPVASVARTPNNLDLFITGGDGRVYTSWWFNGVDWSGVNDSWRSLGGFFPPAAPVEALARTPENLDLFITGGDGRVYTSWWFNGADWSGVNDNWRSIGGFFPAGAPVTAVARTPGNLDLFIVGGDGRVYTSWWFNGADWSGVNDNWRSIGGFFPAGARVSAVARKPGQLDLFVCGGDGRVYTSWWTEGQDWSGVNDNWRSIGGFFPAGARVSAVARNPEQLDLFITGGDGRVYTSWWFNGADWSGVNDNWRPIGGFFPAGAPVDVVARTPDNLDLFIVGGDGRVYTSWWFQGADWSGVNDNWRPIGGFFPAGAPIDAVARSPHNLDLFLVGGGDRVHTSWWSG